MGEGFVTKIGNYYLLMLYRSGKDSRPSTLGSDTDFSDTRINRAVKDEMDHYQGLKRVNKDGRRLAVLSADELEDGLILIPGAESVISCDMYLGHS